MSDRSPAWTAGDPGLDLASPAFYGTEGHFDVWREARATHPIAWTSSPRVGGFWSVTTHDLGGKVIKQPKNFTSVEGMRLGSNPASVRSAANQMMVVADGKHHRRLRAVHSPWFTGRAVAGMAPDLDRRLTRHVDELVRSGEPFDAVTELAVKVPNWVLCQMMGVPPADWDELSRLTDIAFTDSDDSERAAEARATAHADIFVYFTELMELRRDRPGNDIVSTLVHTEVDGERLSDKEVLLNCDGLMNGGLETTPHASAGAILAFSRFPDTWRRLRKDPSLIDTAIEEILRWTSPPMHAMRTAVRDIQLGAAEIKEGDPVVVWLPSCNRDEAVFTDPDEFVIDRRPNPHLCFGAGPHYCIGAVLARLELRCLLDALIPVVQSFELAGDVRRKRSSFLNGIDRMDITVVPETSG